MRAQAKARGEDGRVSRKKLYVCTRPPGEREAMPFDIIQEHRCASARAHACSLFPVRKKCSVGFLHPAAEPPSYAPDFPATSPARSGTRTNASCSALNSRTAAASPSSSCLMQSYSQRRPAIARRGRRNAPPCASTRSRRTQRPTRGGRRRGGGHRRRRRRSLRRG